jgi:hypothetical protein
MLNAIQLFGRSLLIVSPFLVTCLSSGQVVNSATASLQPSGEIRYQATYLFQLEPAAEPLVLNAPYSADEVEYSANISSTASSDGQPRLLRKIYRDSKGRTRIERSLSLGPNNIQGPALIQIFDPASGWACVLDSQAKVAHRYRPPAPGVLAPEKHEKQFVVAAIAASGKPTRHSTIQASESSVSFQPPKTATLPVAVVANPTEALGEMSLDGLRLRGTRYITPVVSDDGTRRTMTSEVWTSPELQIVVLSASLNQQPSDRLVRLAHLTRTEPDAALFQVPSSYQIQDETTDFHIGANFGEAQHR